MFYSFYDWPDPDQRQEGDREGLGLEPEGITRGEERIISKDSDLSHLMIDFTPGS